MRDALLRDLSLMARHSGATRGLARAPLKGALEMRRWGSGPVWGEMVDRGLVYHFAHMFSLSIDMD